MSVMTLPYCNAIGESVFSAELWSSAQIEKFPNRSWEILSPWEGVIRRDDQPCEADLRRHKSVVLRRHQDGAGFVSGIRLFCDRCAEEESLQRDHMKESGIYVV